MPRQGINVVDEASPTVNMYGCEPCSKCRSRYRHPVMKVLLLGEPAVLVIVCDDCETEVHGTRRYE